jgi:hypothetical protein
VVSLLGFIVFVYFIAGFFTTCESTGLPDIRKMY